VYLLDRGFTKTEIGVVLGILGLAAFLTSPLWGYTADRVLGSTRTLALCAGVAGVLSLLFFLPFDGVIALTSIALGMWIFRSPLVSLIDAIALDWLGSSRRAGYAGIRAWQSVGWALSAVLWGALLELSRLDLVPALYATTIVVVALYAALGLDAGAGVRRVRAEVPAAWTSRRLGLPAALLGFLLSTFLLNAAFAATWNFLAVRIVDLGGGAFLVGLAASVQAFAEVPAMAWIGRLSQLISHRAIYVGGCVIYITVFAAWAVLTDPITIALLKVVLGVGFALTYVGAVVIVDDLVPTRLRATGQSFSKAVGFGLAPILGTAVGGPLYDHLGPRPMFIASAAAATAAAAIAWISISHPQTRLVEVEADV
jgi:PPP family 3-phenylpropionic acid transporter